MQVSKEKLSHRELKKIVHELLQLPDPRQSVERICSYPFRQVVNPLFSFLYSLDVPMKWRAVSAMGAVIARAAGVDMESARVVMRRFIWNLNDESGGIGWGSPESMGEATALNQALADQYGSILLSYINPDGNYLEHEDLQPGVLWGIGRLAHARPGFGRDAIPFLPPYLASDRAALRGMAVWVAGALPPGDMISIPDTLKNDTAVFTLYRQGVLEEVRICELVAKLVERSKH
ncbi:MAG: DVU0298 family protein [Desulfobacterales bacterium]